MEKVQDLKGLGGMLNCFSMTHG